MVYCSNKGHTLSGTLMKDDIHTLVKLLHASDIALLCAAAADAADAAAAA